MSSISEIIWNLTHTLTDQTPQIQHNLGLNCFENGHLGIQKRGPPDLEMLVMIFHAQVIESCRDGPKHIPFCDSHVLCSKMRTYLWAIPNIRHSLATHYIFSNFLQTPVFYSKWNQQNVINVNRSSGAGISHRTRTGGRYSLFTFTTFQRSIRTKNQ